MIPAFMGVLLFVCLCVCVCVAAIEQVGKLHPCVPSLRANWLDFVHVEHIALLFSSVSNIPQTTRHHVGRGKVS